MLAVVALALRSFNCRLRQDEQRIGVALLVLVFSVVFVLVVSFSRTCCLVVRCWLGVAVMVMRVVGRVGLSLLMTSLSTAAHLELFAVVSQVVTVRSSSLLDLSGCKC